MKSKEELNALKEEVEAVSQDLTDEELEQVAGGLNNAPNETPFKSQENELSL